MRVTVHRAEYEIEMTDTGVRVSGPAGERVIPWETVVTSPTGFLVTCDGWAHSSHAVESSALDTAADLRAAGGCAQIVRVGAAT